MKSPVSPAAPPLSLLSLRDSWAAQWPLAHARWRKFTRLSQPRWCFSDAQAEAHGLTESFAMIRLNDQAVVINLAVIEALHLERFALQILAHAIGHRVYAPADLIDSARRVARKRWGLPTKEHLALFISNLYTDLLINDPLQSSAGLSQAGVVQTRVSKAGDPLWRLYLRIFEILWSLQRGNMTPLTTNGQRLAAPDLIQHIAETHDEVTVSVDGLAEFHDAGRGAPGLFERLRVIIGQLAERKPGPGASPMLRANTILMRSNMYAFEERCAALADWGIQEVTFHALGGQPAGPDYPRERLLPAHFAWLRCALPGIRQRMAARGLVIRGAARYLDRLDRGARGEPMAVIDCHPGADFLFIDEESRVAPCSFTTSGYGLPMAEIHAGADLAQLPAHLADNRRQALLAPCLACPSTQVFGKYAFAEAP